MYPCFCKWQDAVGYPVAKQMINVQLASAANFLLEIDKFSAFCNAGGNQFSRRIIGERRDQWVALGGGYKILFQYLVTCIYTDPPFW
jgi:hypothetical protein